jgi:hypothetical protein
VPHLLKGVTMYPQTALQALNYLKTLPDCDFVDFSIEGAFFHQTPYLMGKTRDGQWVTAWDISQTEYYPDHPEHI